MKIFVAFVLFTRSMPSTGACTATLPQLLWLQTRRCAVARAAGCGVWRGNSRTRGGLRGGTPQVAPPVHTRHQTCRPASSSGCVADRQLILSVDFICLLCEQVNMTVVGSSYTARPASSSASVPATGPQFSGETTKSSKGIIF